MASLSVIGSSFLNGQRSEDDSQTVDVTACPATQAAERFGRSEGATGSSISPE